MRAEGVIACFGELLLRLSAPGAQLLLQTPTLEANFGGAEANVAVSLACLGDRVRIISVLPDNPLGYAARDGLRRHGVDTSGVSFSRGRLGLYFLAPGAGMRAPEVTYDRAGSAFAEEDFSARDWTASLAGAGWLHVSGVTPALGARCADATIAAVSCARAAGLRVSFDGNYRAKLWASRSAEAPAILRKIIGSADTLFGDHRDIGLALGGAFARSDEAAEAAFAAFPNLERIVHTQRIEHSAGRHDLSAMMYTRAQSWSAPAIVLTEIVDRIGAGDAFAAGVIHALRRDWDGDTALRFALTAAALKHATPGDWNLASEQDVRAALAGNGVSVRR